MCSRIEPTHLNLIPHPHKIILREASVSLEGFLDRSRSRPAFFKEKRPVLLVKKVFCF